MNTNISLRQKRPDSTPSCYLVSSLNENIAKQLCRRNPNLVIKWSMISLTTLSQSVCTEKQIMRSYPADCAKYKTKNVAKNGLNPIWNDVFTFQVMYSELAFIRFVVTDTVTSHVVAHLVIPLKCLRPGYRLVRLRNTNNQLLELGILFIFSKHEEELIEPCSRLEYTQDSTSAILKSMFGVTKDMSDIVKDGKDI
ncbi:1-phosphatidylinositol 4 [Mactra antiquata]